MTTTNAILNEGLRFTDLADTEQRSFRPAPAAEYVALPKGTRLYKWTSYPLIRWDTRGGGRVARISPFWSSMDGLTTPGGRTVPSFAEMRKRYKNTGGGVGAPRDWARARSAVTQEWNSMDAILFIVLDQMVYSFVGQAAHQPVSDGDRSAVWIGGDFQIVIPGLTEKHCHQIG